MNDREMKTRKRCEYFIFLMPTVHNWLGPFIFKNRTRLDSGTTYYMYLYCHCKTVFDGRNKPEMGWNLISQTNPNRSEPVFIRFEIRSVPSNYDATSVQSTDWRPGFEIWKSRLEFWNRITSPPRKKIKSFFIFCCASTHKLQGRRIEERSLYILPHKPNKTKQKRLCKQMGERRREVAPAMIEEEAAAGGCRRGW